MRTYFAFVGVICFAGAIRLTARRLRVQLFGLVAVGTVVAHRVGEFDDSKSYLPVVTFSDLRGVEFQFTSAVGGGSERPMVGAEVLVRYLPSDPRICYVATFFHMWAVPLAAVILGSAGIAALWVK